MNGACRAFAPASLLISVLAAACAGRPDTPPRDPARGGPVSHAGPADATAFAAVLGVPPDSLLAAGRERYDRQAFDSARAIWQVELGRARGAADSGAEARVLMWLGLANWHLNDYPAARRDGEASVILKQRLGLDAELWKSFNALGLLAWHEGRLHDALVLFDSVIASAGRNRDAAGLARAAGNIPLVQTELGEFDAAHRGFLAAREAFRAIGDDLGLGNAFANLAMLEIRLGNPAAAVPLLAEARRRYAGAHADEEANALGQLATAWSALGDLQRAIADADSGLAIARAHGLDQESASILEVLADIHLKAGNRRLALQRLREADGIDSLLGLAIERGNNLRRSAAILFDLGEISAAVAQAERGLAAHQEVEARAEIVQDRLQLALALWEEGDRPRAGREAELGLKDAAALANPAVLRDAAAVAAKLALQNGDAQQALRHASRVSALGTMDDWALADLRAGAYLALGRLDQARTEAERAVAGLERERGSLAVGPLRSAYFMGRAGPFSRLVAIHLARGDTAAAFRVAAALPGRALAERMGGLADSAGPAGSAVAGERLLLRIAVLELALDSLRPAPADADRRAGLIRALDETRSAYEEHLAHAALSPGDRQLGLGVVTLEQVQSRLADDEAFLTFLSGPERLDLFLVRRTGVVHRSLTMGARDLAARVRVARELLAARSGPEALAGLGELQHLLFGPLLDAGALRGVTRLLIVPHGSLAALPFAALWNRQTGRSLVEDYVVSYLPAAAALNERGPAPLVDPGRMTVFAPLPDSLPGTAREARAIAHLLPGARIRLGGASGEPEVRRALEAGGSVHLASHGSQNSQNPLFSSVTAGRRSGPGSGGDGRLEVHEILGIRTTSPLVFLSGCETGLATAGLEPFAEGIEEGSLAQAFLVAGAGTVVATLWRVGDAGAAAVAERFYRHLGPGVPVAEALALAQREVLRSRAGSGWAAYAAWGTGGRKIAGQVRVTGIEP